MGDRDSDWALLRGLVLGPDEQRLAELRKRLEDPVTRAEDIGEVLPQVLQLHAHDPHLAKALTPPLEKAITASVQRNPKPLADALFPVMGPAIRKAVSAGLASMVESLNRTLEHSLSWRSFRWRVEGWRTGKSFGEIVLLKTLVYRVEQAYLIDRKTGLLLQHVRAGTDAVQDANMVSGMLTAIRDFAQDSFKVGEQDSLETFQVGDLTVWIEAGPHAILAAVIRGSAPRDLRRALQDALESIHLEFGHVLETFDGDARALDDARPALEACLQTEFRASERHPPTRGAWVVFGLAAIALVVWLGFSYRASSRWGHYLDALRSEPGIVVVSEGRRGGKFVVSGLRDPLARDPQSFIAPTGLETADVAGVWAPYQALDSPIALARATRVLQPPAGAPLTLTDGVLSVTGPAPPAWILETQRTAPLIAGVTRFDTAGAFDLAWRSVASRIEARVLLFVKDGTRSVEGQDEEMRQLVSAARELDTVAAAGGLRLMVQAVGHTDVDGPPETNAALSLARAEVVRTALAGEVMAHLHFTAAGVGSTVPAVTGQTEADNQKNRRVTMRVTREDDKK
jgi:OOP family OmpA-OmpF porin